MPRARLPCRGAAPVSVYLAETVDTSPHFWYNNRRHGRLAEWSMASVLKTEDRQRSGGSNPSPSAIVAARRISQQGKRFLALFALAPAAPFSQKIFRTMYKGASRALSACLGLGHLCLYKLPRPRTCKYAICNPSPSSGALLRPQICGKSFLGALLFAALWPLFLLR